MFLMRRLPCVSSNCLLYCLQSPRLTPQSSLTDFSAFFSWRTSGNIGTTFSLHYSCLNASPSWGKKACLHQKTYGITGYRKDHACGCEHLNAGPGKITSLIPAFFFFFFLKCDYFPSPFPSLCCF